MKIHHTPRILVGIFAVFTVSAMLACFAFSSTASALQTVPYKMNFQGRLTDASGNAMANGTYNMKFRIYDALSGGSLQWSEQRANFSSTGVTVANGLFSVQLGDVSSLPVGIFTNQNLYFEIELPTPATATCSTSACESYTEGPMGPRNKLGTSAYAFNSDTLDGIDSTGFIQNTGSVQTATFNITGVGTASTLQAANFDQSTSAQLTIGATNATSIALSQNTSIANGKTLTVNGSTVLTGAGISQTLSGTNYMPSIVGSLAGGAGNLNGAHAIAAMGKYVYVYSKWVKTFVTIDVSVPSNPVVLGVLTDATHLLDCKQMVIVGKYAYMACNGNNAVEVVDISNPFAPSFGGELVDATNLAGAKGISASGNMLYIAAETSNKISAVSISNPTSPTFVGAGTTAVTAAKGVTVAGKYAYVAAGGGASGSKALTIYDISTPTPTYVGSVSNATTLNFAQAVYVSGRYAYVANASGPGYLTIVDVSTPASPVIVGSVTSANTANLQSVVIMGKYAYGMASTANKMVVFDISNPAAPTELTTLTDATVFAAGQWLASSGRYIYGVGDGSGASNFFVVDTQGSDFVSANIGSVQSNTATITEDALVGNNLNVVNNINAGGNVWVAGDLGVGGKSLLRGNSTAQFQVQNALGISLANFDTSNNTITVGTIDANATLLVLDTKNTAGDPTGTAGAMYYNSNLGKFRCYQGAAWTDCVGAGGGGTLQTAYTASTGGTTPSIKVDSTRGGVSIQDADTTINGSLFAVNGSNAAGLGSNLLSVSSNGQVKMGNLGTATGQVYVSGTLPSLVSTVGASNAVGFGVSGKYAFVSMNAPGFLQSLDLTNPASPVALSTVSITGPTAVAVSGNYAYVANASSITVVDITNPASMTIKGTVSNGSAVSSLSISGKYLYALVKSFNQVQMIDISNPSNPVIGNTFSVISNPDSIEIQGDYVYVGSRTGGVIQAYDASTTTPVAVGSSAALTGVSHMSAHGRYLYAVSSTSTAGKVFDISNPASITSPSTITLSANAMGIVASGNYLYVPESGKFEVFDITTPSTATSLGATTVSSFGIGSVYTDQSIYMNGRYSYVLERGNGGVKIFDMGGVYSSTLQSGSVEASQLSVSQSIGIGHNASIAGTLSVGAGASIFGDTSLTGLAQFRSYANATNAFRIQNATTGLVFVADTINSRIYIGDPAPDANAVVLVVDNSSATTDPTGVNGAMYYNTALAKFRCYEGAWQNCTGVWTSNQPNQSLTAATNTYVTGSQFAVPSAGLRAGTAITWKLRVSKTAAGTAASTFAVVLGTNGTTADTVITSVSTGTATAVADYAIVTVNATVISVGASGVVGADMLFLHNGTATGWGATSNVSGANQITRDTTTAGLKFGLTANTGSGTAATVQSVQISTTNI